MPRRRPTRTPANRPTDRDAPRHHADRHAREPLAPLRIQIAWRLRKQWRAVSLLRRVATHAAHAAGFTTGNLSIAVVGARAMATLHGRYMGSAECTDVLAFDLGCDRRRGVLDGEVVVCADLARRHAATRQPRAAGSKRQSAELALYVVHGILHLAGYDDHAPAAARTMHAREDELLSELGLGPVFGHP